MTEVIAIERNISGKNLQLQNMDCGSFAHSNNT